MQLLPGSSQLSLARLPEWMMLVVSRLLALAWGMLILSLLLPNGGDLGVLQWLHQQGPRLFWGGTVPGVLLLLVLSGHELWRRICPLALISSLPQQRWPWGIGRPRSRIRRVAPDSWLGRHHRTLQAGLLALGLCLRLLVFNSHSAALGVLLLTTVTAAAVVGAVVPGKAWCQYICPLGVVEAILTGPRGLVGSRAQRSPTAPLSQSTCRTVQSDGSETNACVNCQAACIDIDSEHSYWHSLGRGDHLTRLTWCFPGLVAMFFLILGRLGDGSFSGLHSGAWARGPDPLGLLLRPLPPGLLPAALNGPRLVTVPTLLLAGSLTSALTLALLHRQGLSRHRSRLLATALVVPVIVCSVDPTFHKFGAWTDWLVASLSLGSLGLWLRREWNHRRSDHTRERVLQSVWGQIDRHAQGVLGASGSPKPPPNNFEALQHWLSSHAAHLEQHQAIQPLFQGMIRELRRLPHLDAHAAARDLIALHRSLGQPAPRHRELLQRLGGARPR